MDAISFNLCFDTTSLAHRDAVRGERHPPHLRIVTCILLLSAGFAVLWADPSPAQSEAAFAAPLSPPDLSGARAIMVSFLADAELLAAAGEDCIACLVVTRRDTDENPSAAHIRGTEIEFVRHSEGAQQGNWHFSSSGAERLPDFHARIMEAIPRSRAPVNNWRAMQTDVTGPHFAAVNEETR